MENGKELFKGIIISKMEANQVNPLVFAFVGDSIYSFYIKTKKLDLLKLKVKALTDKTREYVNAKAQADFFFKIKDNLTEEEIDLTRRARNANIHTKAKNFSIEEYRYATAFEALLGYLYLTGQNKRIMEILTIGEI